MGAANYVIGLDIGTTCTKALAVAETGEVLGAGSSGYRLFSEGSRIEQNPQDWIAAAGAAVRAAAEHLQDRRCAGISLSTQGASTAAVGPDGAPIGNALTWMDGRAEREAAEIEQELGGAYIYRTSGWKINPSLDAAKLRWMKRQPEYAGAAKYFSTLEILNGYLTGRPAIDPTNAAIRQLYSIESGRWDGRLLAAAGVAEAELPELLPTGAYVGPLCARAAGDMGLPEGVPVFNGAHDQYCAAIGAGAVREGDMLLSAGTTWVLLGIGKRPVFTPSFIAPGRHPVEGLYGAIASLICSGASLQWFKEGFLQEDFAGLDKAVAGRRGRASELCFYPYLAGAGYPFWNRRARGAFTGISLEHDRYDFARAVMEGVAFGVRRAADDFAANGMPIRRMTVLGGAAKSPVWCQMIADASEIPLERLNAADVCALGAAAVALRGAGLCGTYAEASSRLVHPAGVYEPVPESADFYRGKFEKFDRMWKLIGQFYEEE